MCLFMEMLIVNNHIRSWMSSKHRNENAPSYLKVNINILLGWELSALRQIISAWQLKREKSLTHTSQRMSWNITLGERSWREQQRDRNQNWEKVTCNNLPLNGCSHKVEDLIQGTEDNSRNWNTMVKRTLLCKGHATEDNICSVKTWHSKSW